MSFFVREEVAAQMRRHMSISFTAGLVLTDMFGFKAWYVTLGALVVFLSVGTSDHAM